MSFNPGKRSNKRQELRDMLSSPLVPTDQKRRAQDLLSVMSPVDRGEAALYDDDTQQQEEDNRHVDELLGQAEEMLMQCNSAGAKVIIDQALSLATDGLQRAECLDLAVQILIDEGSPREEVLALLTEAELLTPLHSFERLLTLAQFTQDFTALKHYQQAISLVEQQLGTIKGQQLDAEQQEEQTGLVLVKSTAMVAIGELYTTDLCDEADAQERCQQWLSNAIQTDPHNVEALRAYGNFHIIIGDHQQAIKYTVQAFNTLRVVIQQGMEQHVPQFIPRLELCRQLFELQCWNECIALSCGLLEEEQLVGEIWLYALISSYRYAEGLNQKLTKLKASPNPTKATKKQALALTDEIKDLLVCSAQYAVRVQSILKKSPDPPMEAELATYIKQLENMGYTMAKAKQELAKLQKEQTEQLDVDQTILDNIDSDSDDDVDQMAE